MLMTGFSEKYLKRRKNEELITLTSFIRHTVRVKMKKPFLLFIFFSLFFCCNIYADDFWVNNDISELFPEPIGLPQRAIRFEPDPDDLDNDGLKNAEEERYSTSPSDQNDVPANISKGSYYEYDELGRIKSIIRAK